MDNVMLKSALFYHNEGLCVIPVKPRDKMPALPTWEHYQTTRSTESEVREWFSNGSGFNIGIVHGEVSGGFVSLDIDHDAGLWDAMREAHPDLFAGRLEQSGSREGYHIPLIVKTLPDFGYNQKQERPRGNKTWKTKLGDCNIRARHCQTVVPPSIHPTGNRYTFLQKGPIITTDSLDAAIAWLNELAPPPPPKQPQGVTGGGTQITQGDTLVEAVKAAWPKAVDVFAQFGMANHQRLESDGETRLLGNGGLLIKADDPALWYNFSDEIGGDVIMAWGYCRFGSAYDNTRHFRTVLLEMAQAAGLDAARFWRKGDENVKLKTDGRRDYWSNRYRDRWGAMR